MLDLVALAALPCQEIDATQPPTPALEGGRGVAVQGDLSMRRERWTYRCLLGLLVFLAIAFLAADVLPLGFGLILLFVTVVPGLAVGVAAVGLSMRCLRARRPSVSELRSFGRFPLPEPS